MNVWLIHGSDPVELRTERTRVVDKLLAREQRDENLTEFEAGGNRPLALNALLPDLLPELGTVSFFPDARRVAVVVNLSDFWSAERSSKSDPAERLIRYLETDFEGTNNALIFTVQEDPERRRAVDKRKKLPKWIQEHGTLISLEAARPKAFALGDAILERDAPLAIALIREMYSRRDAGQASAIIGTLARQIRFLLQAKIIQSARSRHDESFIDNELLPNDKRHNLLRMHSFPQKKFTERARFFQTSELLAAQEDLFQLSRHVIPSGEDPYVADVGLLLEKLTIRLCAGVRESALR